MSTGIRPARPMIMVVNIAGERSHALLFLFNRVKIPIEAKKATAWYFDARLIAKNMPAAPYRNGSSLYFGSSIPGSRIHRVANRPKLRGPSGTTNRPAEIRKNGAIEYQARAQKAAELS